MPSHMRLKRDGVIVKKERERPPTQVEVSEGEADVVVVVVHEGERVPSHL